MTDVMAAIGIVLFRNGPTILFGLGFWWMFREYKALHKDYCALSDKYLSALKEILILKGIPLPEEDDT